MLPADLTKQVGQELASGHYRSHDELIEQAVRHFFDQRQRSQQRLHALRRIGQAVNQAGLYERVLIPALRPSRIQALHPQSFLNEIFREEQTLVMKKLEQQAAGRKRSLRQLLTILNATVPEFGALVFSTIS